VRAPHEGEIHVPATVAAGASGGLAVALVFGAGAGAACVGSPVGAGAPSGAGVLVHAGSSAIAKQSGFTFMGGFL
jgi:hypothetical protein